MVYRQLAIANIQSSSPDDGSNPAPNSIDGSLSTRYSSPGIGAQITYDLGQSFDVQDVDVAWYRGDERRVAFRTRISEDLSTWTDVFLGESSGTTTDYEKFNCVNKVGRYIRLVFEGGSQTEWFSISEARINGDDPPSALDQFGIAKIYPDAVSPVFANMDQADARKYPVDNWPSTFQITTESVPGGYFAWHFEGVGRLALWSPDNKPWGNVEMTFYVKMLTGPTTNGTHGDANRLLQPYIGGGHHHSQTADACEGNAMKACIFGGGDLCFRKEICHPAYCGDRGHYNNFGGFPHATDSFGGTPANMANGFRNRWYGVKLIQKLMSDRCTLEAWIDEGADNGSGGLVIAGNETRWRLWMRYDDIRTGTAANGAPTGDWTSTSYSSDCGSCTSATIGSKVHAQGLVRLVPWGVTHSSSAPNHDFNVTDAAACQIRTDGTNGGYLAFYSAREIAG